MPVARQQGQGQQAGQFQLPAQPGRFHVQSQPGQFQGLPQYQGQQPGRPQVQVKQPSQQYYPYLPNFPQGSPQSSRPGLFQAGQPQGHLQGPDQHAAAQTHRHMLPPQQQQQQSMGPLSSEGIIRPQAVRSQGWTMHKGHQQSPAGQLTALPSLQGTSLGLTHPQALPVRQSHPYMFGTGPPSVFQGQDGPHVISQAQRVSQPALPAPPTSVLPKSGPGQLAAAPSSIQAPQAAFSPAPHVHDDQAMLHPGQSVTQHVQNPTQHSPKISQYGAAHQGPSVPQQGQSMQEHAHSMPQYDHSVIQPGQESSQNRQVMPQPAASESQSQHNQGTQMQEPSYGTAPQVHSQLPALAKPCNSKHVHLMVSNDCAAMNKPNHWCRHPYCLKAAFNCASSQLRHVVVSLRNCKICVVQKVHNQERMVAVAPNLKLNVGLEPCIPIRAACKCPSSFFSA